MARAIAPSQLGFSLYGMKNVPLDRALPTCAEIGYGNVEIALLPGFPTDPKQLGPDDRKRLRDRTQTAQLSVSCLMENLAAVTNAANHQENLNRIARAAALWRDLVPEGPRPLLETVLGGKPSDWPDVRKHMVAALRDWAEAARKHDLVLAIKPHVSGAVHLPEQAMQLLDEIDSPHLQAVFDYSHYQVQGLSLEASLATLSARTVFVHVKDGRRVDGKVQFLLPGEGDVDYVTLFALLAQQRYAGSVTVEVSAQLSSRPDYDPRAAAERSFAHLSHAAKVAADRAPKSD
jgi:inosose dehydratase